jgi:hypothetical protein
MNKEVVIAAYDKPLDWLFELNTDVKKTVYRKGNIMPLVESEILVEPNLGRCVHTFFNHLYINYDNLADITFFGQDYPFDHWGNMVEIINGDIKDIPTKASIRVGEYYGFHNNTLGTAWGMPLSEQFGNGRALMCLSNGHPQDLNPLINVDKYWGLLFEGPPPNVYEFIPGGHFAITKEQVRLRSREFYKKITELLIEDITAPWMIERLECYIFDSKRNIKI